MTSRKTLFLALLLSCHHSLGQEEELTASALDLEDDCASGQEDMEACTLSLRQLRGQTHRPDTAPGERISEEGHPQTGVVSATEHRVDGQTELEQVSSASAGQGAAEKQAPTYNYNYYFGDDDSQPSSATPTVETPTNSNGGPVYNYNWHFNIGDDDDKDTSEDKKNVKTGNCQTFGCIQAFDMAKLFDSCQCFPGCDQTPLGNVCCSDYKQTCAQQPQQQQFQNSWDPSYFEMAHTDCTHGMGWLGHPMHLFSKDQCKASCNQNAQCKGYTYNALNKYCVLLSSINLKKCRKWLTASTGEKFTGASPAPPPPAWGSSGAWGAAGQTPHWGSAWSMPHRWGWMR